MYRLLHKYNEETRDLGLFEDKEEAKKEAMKWIKEKSTLRGKHFVIGQKNGMTFIDYGASNSCFFIRGESK